MSTTQVLEAVMLACFGLSWPLASIRMLRTRRAEGRGVTPTALVLAGYLAGMAAKIGVVCAGGTLPPIFWMYLLNAVSVSANMALQWRFGAHRVDLGLRRAAA